MLITHKTSLYRTGYKISMNVKYMSKFVSPTWSPNDYVSHFSKYWPFKNVIILGYESKLPKSKSNILVKKNRHSPGWGEERIQLGGKTDIK